MADPATKPSGVRLKLAPDARFAFGAIEHDKVLEKAGLVVVERFDFDRSSRAPTGRQKPMAISVRPRADVLHIGPLRQLRATDHKGHDAPAVEQYEPSNGPGEHQLALAVFEVRVPAHLLREREKTK